RDGSTLDARGPRCQSRLVLFFFQAEDGIRDFHVTGVQTCALPILIAIPLTANPMMRAIGARRSEAAFIAQLRPMVSPSTEIIGKIGRASCREMVEMSVGAVSVKETSTSSIGTTLW